MDAHNTTKLGEALEVLCLDCTRYEGSDNLAKGLAIISLSPYLAILHTASVSSSASLLLQFYICRGIATTMLFHLHVPQKARMLMHR
jgi:hypothetical protein